MKRTNRIFHSWRFGCRALRLELIVYLLALLAYASCPWWLELRAQAQLEEVGLPCLMIAAAWLAGRIMLVDPLPHPRAFWRTMPWSAKEMAWGRAGLAMAAVFAPWLAAHALRLLALRPEPGLFFSAFANALAFWPLMALSVLVAGLSRSLVIWVLSPVAAFVVVRVVSMLPFDRTWVFVPNPSIPWKLASAWQLPHAYQTMACLGSLVILAGLLLMAWRAGRVWAWGIIAVALLMANGGPLLTDRQDPPLVMREGIRFPDPEHGSVVSISRKADGLKEGEFLQLREADGEFSPEAGKPVRVEAWSGFETDGLCQELIRAFPGALRVGHWGAIGESYTLTPVKPPSLLVGDGVAHIQPGPGRLKVNAVFDVCRMELLADWPLTAAAGTESWARGQRLVLEALSQDSSAIRASVVIARTESWGGNFLRKYQQPIAVLFVLVLRDGTMIRPGGENGGYVSRQFFNGRSITSWGLGWEGILTDPWQTGAVSEWLEGCRLKVYAAISLGAAVQRFDRQVERFPDQPPQPARLP